MKKSIALILAGMLLLAVLSACGGGTADTTPQEQGQAESAAQAAQDTDREEPEEAPAAEEPEEAQQETEEPEPEETPEPEPEELGDFELYFFLTTPDAFSVGQYLVSYAESIEAATDGHVRFTIDNSAAQGGMSAEDHIKYDRGFGEFYRETLRTEYYRQGMPDGSYALFRERALLPFEAVTIPLQGFDDGVATTKALWDLYREDTELFDLIEENYKILMFYAKGPILYAVEDRPPENEYFDYSRDIGGIGCVYYVCCSRDTWDDLPKAYQEIIEGLSGYEPSLELAEMQQASVEESRQAWKESLPEFMEMRGLKLLEPSEENYAQYEAFFDDFTVQWTEKVTEDTGLDAAAILARLKELYESY